MHSNVEKWPPKNRYKDESERPAVKIKRRRGKVDPFFWERNDNDSEYYDGQDEWSPE
jgi:hypothetical protein